MLATAHARVRVALGVFLVVLGVVVLLADVDLKVSTVLVLIALLKFTRVLIVNEAIGISLVLFKAINISVSTYWVSVALALTD